jgi:DNA-binding NarL/FixJ family response regulator
VRVVIADDHRLVLDGIRRALEADGDFEIVGETQSGMQVLPLVAREKPTWSCSPRVHPRSGRGLAVAAGT